MKTVKPRSIFGKLTRRQKASLKKFHAKIEILLGIEIDERENTRPMMRKLDLYFDDIEELINTIYKWKYESWMDMKKKFDGKECRGWKMKFEKFPSMKILPASGDGRNTNKSFRGSVTSEEVQEVFSGDTNRSLTDSLRSLWEMSNK